MYLLLKIELSKIANLYSESKIVLIVNISSRNKFLLYGISLKFNVQRLLYTGNIWWGKFWRTMQVKAIGEENLANKPQSVHMS